MWLVWVVIPLVVFSIIGIQESFADQASGKPAWEVSSDKVCGDKLCSESPNTQQSKTVKLSPLKQFKNGVSPYYIVCEDNLQIIIKKNNNLPACVKPETALKLLERGWTEKVSIGIWTNVYESQVGNFVDSYFSPKYQLSDDSTWVQRYSSADGYPPLVILRATLFSIDSYTNEIIDHYLSFTIKNNTISSIREYYDYGRSRLISLDTAKLQEIELAENRRGSLDHIITNLEDYYDQKVTVEGKLFKWRNWPGMGHPITFEICSSLKSVDQYRTLDAGWWILKDQVGNSLAVIKDNLNSQKWSPEDEFLGKQVSINGTLIPITTTVGCSSYKSAYLLFENIELI